MSDLHGGTAGQRRAPDVSTSSSAPAMQMPSSGMRTPRDIMNQRQAREAAREARKRAEAEVAAGTGDERLVDAEQPNRASERHTGPSVNTSVLRDSGYRSAGIISGERGTYGPSYSTTSPTESRTPAVLGKSQMPITTNQPQPRIGTTATGARDPSLVQDPARAYTQQQAAAPTTMQQSRVTAGTTIAASVGLQGARGSNVPPVIAPASGITQPRSNVSSFPHSFERWETLSSHWEGLTSYWVRRLELNSEQIRKDLTMSQMSRQITDLSAAGANLFHAVVELQRLRASSERKFQRWFFETRAQQESDQDEIARLQDDLDAERQVGMAAASRADMENRFQEVTTSYLELERRNTELRRELQISKEEARRAWEELGRREQEERDRQLALREGFPIYIGGVQVQPMQGSILSRGGSVRESGYPTHLIQGSTGQTEREHGSYEAQQPSPTNTDPYTGSQSPARTQGVGQYRGYDPDLAQTSPPPPNLGGLSGSGAGNTRVPQSGSGSTGPLAAHGMTSRYYQQPEMFAQDPETASSRMQRHMYPSNREEGHDEGYGRKEEGELRYGTESKASRQQQPAGSKPHNTSDRSAEEDDDDEGDIPTFEAAGQVARYGRVHARSTSGESSRSGPTIRSVPTPSQPRSLDPAEYEGEGFGEAAGWEVQSRYPSNAARLSDVKEEEDDGHSYMSSQRMSG